MAINSKAKGGRGERELVAIFAGLGYNSHRNDQKYVGGLDNPDVSLPGVHIECKRSETLRLYDAVDQAIRDANGKALPVVMHRKNNHPWVAIMPLDAWVELYDKWERDIEKLEK